MTTTKIIQTLDDSFFFQQDSSWDSWWIDGQVDRLNQFHSKLIDDNYSFFKNEKGTHLRMFKLMKFLEKARAFYEIVPIILTKDSNGVKETIDEEHRDLFKSDNSPTQLISLTTYNYVLPDKRTVEHVLDSYNFLLNQNTIIIDIYEETIKIRNSISLLVNLNEDLSSKDEHKEKRIKI